jgi:hypothetical protein
MTPTQILILIAAMGLETGRIMGTLASWDQAHTPAFIGSALMAICLQIMGIVSKGPSQK